MLNTLKKHLNSILLCFIFATANVFAHDAIKTAEELCVVAPSSKHTHDINLYDYASSCGYTSGDSYDAFVEQCVIGSDTNSGEELSRQCVGSPRVCKVDIKQCDHTNNCRSDDNSFIHDLAIKTCIEAVN